MKLLILLLVAFILVSCHISKPGLRSEGTSQISEQDTAVFIFMKIWKDSVTRKTKAELLEIIKKPARLKSQSYENLTGNYLKCILSGTIDSPKDSFTIEHPLYRQIEFPAENNRFGKKEIVLKEHEFVVRFNKNNFNAILIKEFSPVSSGKELITIKF